MGLGTPQRKFQRQKQRTADGVRMDTIFPVAPTPSGGPPGVSSVTKRFEENQDPQRAEKFHSTGAGLAHGWRPGTWGTLSPHGADDAVRGESPRGQTAKRPSPARGAWGLLRSPLAPSDSGAASPSGGPNPAGPGSPLQGAHAGRHAPTAGRGTGGKCRERSRPLPGRRGAVGRAPEFCLHGDRAGRTPT